MRKVTINALNLTKMRNHPIELQMNSIDGWKKQDNALATDQISTSITR